MTKQPFTHPLTRRQVLVTLAGGVATSAFGAFTRFAHAADMTHLRIMETTDVHVHLYNYDYYRDREDDKVGLAKVAAHINAIRAEAANSILVDNGDFLQGNPLGDYMAYERGLKLGDVHPVMKAMNALAFDAATLGNHEFNYGLSFLEKAVAGANFPVVSANVVNGTSAAADPRNNKTLYKPYTILERELITPTGHKQSIKIGLIGFVPPQIMIWDRQNLEGNVNAIDIVAAARAYVPEMQEQGTDLIIALAHTGIETGLAKPMQANAAYHLAAVSGIDAILSGHQHRVFPGAYTDDAALDNKHGSMQDVPTVMAGFWGSHLGVIDLALHADGNGWQVGAFSSEAKPIYRSENRKTIPLVSTVPEVLASVVAEHEATLVYVRRAVGTTEAPLFSYFAQVADDPSVQIVSKAQIWYVNQILANGEYAALPVLSAAAPFKAGGRGGPDYYTDVPVGAVAIKNVADLYLYPNTVRAVLLDGAGVREWLEHAAGMFNQIQENDTEQNLLNVDFPSYNFDVIDGVTYQIDLSQPRRYDNDGKVINPAAHRIQQLQFAGKPIDMQQKFVIATNNYRASGGGHFPGLDGSNIILNAPDTNRDVIVRYINDRKVINPQADDNWKFSPLPGATQVMFTSSPNGRKYIDAMPAISYVNDREDGFANYRIALGK